MDVKPGYKQTEVGVIPEKWAVKPMVELFTFQNGVNADKSAYGHGVPFINVLEVITHPTITEARIPGRIALSAQALNVFAVRHGDVLFNRTSETQGEVGLASVYVGTDGVVFGGFVIRARPRESRMNHRFMCYALRSSFVRSQIVARGQGVVRANVGQQDLARVQVVLPTGSEQEAITEALSDADALIESLEHLLAKKRQIKQGAMQELLTGNKRLPGFSGEWDTRQLGQVGHFLKGRGVARDESLSGDVPCVRYGEIYTRHNDHINDFYSRISRAVAATATRLACGDVLFAGSGETKEEIGKCIAFLDNVEAYAGGDIVILRPTAADSMFLGYYLNTEPIRRQKASSGQGDAVVHISAAALAGIEVALPSVREQSAIATVLSDMDAELAALEARLAKARAIKQGMMHELLTGRIRLV